MAGTMNAACRDVRPVLAECLMLDAPYPETAAQHLERCPECRRVLAEIKEVARTLDRGAPRAIGHSADCAVRPAADLGDRVRRGVAQAGRERTRRRHRIALTAAATLAAAAAVLVPVMSTQQSAPPTAAVALAREGQMVSHTWGTEVPVAVTGLQPGQTYRLMTSDSSGHIVPGGSVRVPEPGTVYTKIMTAMQRNTITAVIVKDVSGQVVARMPIASPPTPASA